VQECSIFSRKYILWKGRIQKWDPKWMLERLLSMGA
jgi:hypothetical protein